MSEKSKNWEKALVWAGIILTVIFGIPAFIALHEKRPHISYEIINDSKILDIRQPVDELEIRYRGEDIVAQKKNLVLLKIKIQNDGETHIKPDDFDPVIPWGIRIDGAQIINLPKLTSDNSKYIHDNLNLSVEQNSVVKFQKIIFETGKYFILEIQLLQRADEELNISVLGKVTGIDEARMVKTMKDENITPFWASVFFGSIKINIIRALVILGGALGLLLLMTVLFLQVSAKFGNIKLKRRRLAVKAYLQPFLQGKSRDYQQTASALLSVSRGDVGLLKEVKLFFTDRTFRENYLTGFPVYNRNFKMAQINRMASAMGCHGEGPALFAIKNLEQINNTILRAEALQALDGLIYLLVNNPPSKKIERYLQLLPVSDIELFINQ